jgi:DNA-directed RNA polymerase specialized sigma24 family protein
MTAGITLPHATTTAEHELAALQREHGRPLFALLLRLCDGDRQRAEDLLQDVLLAMYRRFGETLDLDNPHGYARRAIANANVSWARRSASREVPIAALPDRAGDAVDDAERD